jgi:predicted branched-subunit amino acid permease
MFDLRQSLVVGLQSSGAFFVSTFLFGLMFGIAAAASGLEHWQALFMSATVFSASAQFASLEFWQHPLPLGTIALSVFLISTRNLLLGMSMTHHFDDHGMRRKLICMFLLNDPGVVTALRLNQPLDKLGYITGYGISLMASWLLSTWAGLHLVGVLPSHYTEPMDFAGPLVLATMMVLFAKGSGASPVPWIVSGLAALVLSEVGIPIYMVLPLSVALGTVSALKFRGQAS